MSRFQNSAANTIQQAAGNPLGISIFNGKTLAKVWEEYNLQDEDVDVATSNIAGFGELRTIIFAIEGVRWAVPLSNSFPVDKLEDEDYLGNCMFRTGFKLKRVDGEPVLDSEGKKVLDEMRPYLNLGKPSGLTFDSIESLFTPVPSKTVAPKKPVTGTKNVA